MFTLLYLYSMIGISPMTFGSTASTLMAVASCSGMSVMIGPTSPPERRYTAFLVNTSKCVLPLTITTLMPITGSLPGRME